MQSRTGFTLIELLVTVAVAATLITIAIPSYRHTIDSNRLSTLANDYILSINEARMEAIRRNTTVQVCAPSGNGSGDLASACGSTQAGAVYSLPADPDEDPVLIRTSPPMPGSLTIIQAQALRYTAQGLARAPGSDAPYAGLVADLRIQQNDSVGHRCIYMTTGTSLKTCVSDGNCDASNAPNDCP